MKNKNWERIPSRPNQQAKGKGRRFTFNLFLLLIESLARGLDRLLQAKDRGFLLLDGLAQILVETLSWFSSPLSRETSSSRCLRVACAPSSAARSC
jgi:hypothetical protein